MHYYMLLYKICLDQVHCAVHPRHGPERTQTMPRRCRNQVPCAQDRDVLQILSSSYGADTGSPSEPVSTRCSTPGTGSMVSTHAPPASCSCASISSTSSASALADDRMLQTLCWPGCSNPLLVPKLARGDAVITASSCSAATLRRRGHWCVMMLPLPSSLL